MLDDSKTVRQIALDMAVRLAESGEVPHTDVLSFAERMENFLNTGKITIVEKD